MEKEKYEPFKKKYNLPSFKELDRLFEISDIEVSNGFLLRQVRKKIHEKIDFLNSLLNEVIYPEPSSLVSMHECRVFSEKDKEEAFDLFGQLMTLVRTSNELELSQMESHDAEFIKNVHKEWKSYTKRVSVFVGKMKESWKKTLPSDEELNYLG